MLMQVVHIVITGFKRLLFMEQKENAHRFRLPFFCSTTVN
jgi:hypothetical protein